MIIISTAIVGSYLFIRGISMYAGGYPGEVTLINDLKMRDMSSIDPVFYAYMVGFLLATLFSIILQYKYWAQKDEYKHPYHYSR
jgi:Ca2+/H+ antiporter